jgi:tetratricopeptide (TPR) repeat protein
MGKAASAWEQRGNRASLEESIALLEQVTTAAPNNANAWTQLSHAYYLLADGYMRLAGEDEAMQKTFEKGVMAGERAMMSSSSEFAARVQAGEKVEDAVKSIPAGNEDAIYWYATNLGRFAVATGFTKTLFYKERIYAVMQRVLELNPTFFHGAPHRYFGAYYAKAPAFAGGDLTKAKEHFDKALELEPRYFSTKVLYAEYYATKVENRELFTRLLTEVQQANPNVLPDLVPEQRIEQEKARRLLASVDELF